MKTLSLLVIAFSLVTISMQCESPVCCFSFNFSAYLTYKDEAGQTPSLEAYQKTKVFTNSNGVLTLLMSTYNDTTNSKPFRVSVDTTLKSIYANIMLASPKNFKDDSELYTETVLRFQDGNQDTIKAEVVRLRESGTLVGLHAGKLWYNGYLIDPDTVIQESYPETHTYKETKPIYRYKVKSHTLEKICDVFTVRSSISGEYTSHGYRTLDGIETVGRNPYFSPEIWR